MKIFHHSVEIFMTRRDEGDTKIMAAVLTLQGDKELGIIYIRAVSGDNVACE